MLAFHKRYFAFAMLILGIEVLIACYVRDDFVRPYVGDALVVILIYCFLKSFLNVPVLATSIAVLIFAFTVDLLQLFNIIELLGLDKSKAARIIIGTSFSWIDLLSYLIGISMVIMVEKYVLKINRCS